MNESAYNSIFLIESHQENNNEFGTGFIIYKDDQLAYLITCAHVIDAVGGEKLVKIEDKSATVTAMGASDSLDLAILCVTRSFADFSELQLMSTGQKGDPIVIIGYHDYGQHRLLKPIHGSLSNQGSLKKPKTKGGRVKAWELKMNDDDILQHGYSGSPVIDENSGTVLGIVSHRKGRGEKGLAISVDALNELLPSGKLLDSIFNKTDQEKQRMEQAQKKPNNSANARLQKKMKTLQSAWTDLEDKKDVILKDRAAEDRQMNIDRMSREIEKIEKQQADIEGKLIALEAEM